MKIDLPENVTSLRLKPRPKGIVTLAPKPLDGCRHERAIVDDRLVELECADCHVKLNPIEFLVTLARHETQWGWQLEQLAKAHQAFAERRRCRCTKCGEWTEIRRVGNREVERLRSKKDLASSP